MASHGKGSRDSSNASFNKGQADGQALKNHVSTQGLADQIAETLGIPPSRSDFYHPDGSADYRRGFERGQKSK